MEYQQPGFQESAFQEEEIHLREYWRVIMKYRWTVITLFIIVFITVAIATFSMEPVYKATAQILIDKENPNILSIKEVMSLDAQDTDYYQTQYKILQSRSMAKSVIDVLDLAHNKEFAGNDQVKKNLIASLVGAVREWVASFVASFLPVSSNSPEITDALTPEEVREHEETKLIDAFLNKLQIEPIRNSHLVNIGFLAHDPALASRVVNTLADQYIQHNLKLKYEASMDASQWLNQNVGELKRKMESSEEALHSYKDENKIVSLEEKQDIIVQKLSEINSAVTDAKTKRIRLETLYNQARKFRNNEEMLESLPSVMNNQLILELKKDYIALLAEYTRESKQYGYKHPHIIKINSQLKSLKERIDSEVSKIVNSIKTEYEIAAAQEKVLVDALNEQKEEALELNKKAIKYNVLKRDAESNQQMFEVVLNRLKETDLTRGLKNSNIRIIDRAEVPDSPIKPKKKLNLLLGAIVGLFAGVGLSFFFEYLDNTIKTPEDLKRYLGLPFLGPVPHLDLTETRGLPCPEMIALHKPKSHTSEAYKGLRTSVLFSFPDNSPKALLITSASPSEGKTITSANLAITMAQGGAKVVMIDCDMRKPRLHRLLSMKNEKGISNLLIGQCSVDDVLQDGPVENLKIITCGQRPPNPSELLVSANMKNILDELKKRFDHIIIDSPPLVAVTDSVIISRIVDGIIMVIYGGVTSKDVIMRGKDLLKNVNAPLLGAIINNIDLGKRSYYYYYQYYYYQYYGDDEKKGEKRKRRKKRISSKADEQE
ncbi:MAG: polysaccharide biosynthesis tyrosine autokinase [bacterium]